MKKPIRIRLRRTKGWRLPPNTVVVSRPSKFGNQFRIGHEADSASHAKFLFKCFTIKAVEYRGLVAKELKGKNLACWCPVYICPECKATYDQKGWRTGKVCTNNIAQAGGGALQCWGKVERFPCHADVLLQQANEKGWKLLM